MPRTLALCALPCAAAAAASARNASAAGAGWQAVRPGGRTSCSGQGGKDTEYAFFYHPGEVNKLLVEFEGGGGCWDAVTCESGVVYYTDIDVASKLRYLDSDDSGIHNHRHAENPFRGWHHVRVSYCTGDAHTGDRDRDYGSQTIRHRGLVNTMAALEWMRQGVPQAPETVAVYGCSAGALGAVSNAPYVFQMYPSANHYHWSDGFQGVFTDSMYSSGYENWNLTYPSFVPGLEPAETGRWRPQIAAYIIRTIGAHYPGATLSSFTTNADAVQLLFYTIGGGSPLRWTAEMRDDVAAIHAPGGAGNVATYIGAGTDHCAAERNSWYTVRSGDVRLVDWVRGIMSGERVPMRVDCRDSAECI